MNENEKPDIAGSDVVTDESEFDCSGEVTALPSVKPAVPPRETVKSVSSLFDIVEMLAICAAVILLLFTYCARLTVVDGPSMNNTLTNGDYLIVQSIGYTPKRGDIIVVQDPTATGYEKPLVKRLIAVGGDTVDIDFTTWTVTVNGEVIDESEYLYLDSQCEVHLKLLIPDNR